ncbi:MAG TPA: thioredoxin domain-containing protein [Longimicrobium sp.]
MKSEALLNVVLVVLAVCALTVTGLVVRRELISAPDDQGAPEPTRVADWQAFAAAGHRLGAQRARVTIVEFSDYQCPFCKQLYGRLEEFRKSRPNVVVIHRQYPLDGHPQARPAAMASECAAEQGRFEQIQSTLYARQDSLGSVPWESIAAAAGVPDLTRFDRCMQSGKYSAAIQGDVDAGHQLGIRATPTLLINDMKVEGALTDEALAHYVDAAARK